LIPIKKKIVFNIMSQALRKRLNQMQIYLDRIGHFRNKLDGMTRCD